jgi:hypothetical protein
VRNGRPRIQAADFVEKSWRSFLLRIYFRKEAEKGCVAKSQQGEVYVYGFGLRFVRN